MGNVRTQRCGVAVERQDVFAAAAAEVVEVWRRGYGDRHRGPLPERFGKQRRQVELLGGVGAPEDRPEVVAQALVADELMAVEAAGSRT